MSLDIRRTNAGLLVRSELNAVMSNRITWKCSIAEKDQPRRTRGSP